MGHRINPEATQTTGTNGDSSQAILVGICLDNRTHAAKERSLDELQLLAASAGIETVGKYIQTKSSIAASTYLGKGFIQSMKERMLEENAGLLIFDNELSPTQGRNITEQFDIHTLDRTEVILKIFSEHAKTRESKLQVRLARLNYELPRLRNKWAHFEKQRVAARSKGSGQVARGSGETQYEVDKRSIRDEIYRIRKELKGIFVQRETQRKSRSKTVKKLCLVGYTNAGKSTLFNRITGASVLEQDKLFATLDTTTRFFNTGKGSDMALSDTVGFISDLPHHLVASFQATLKDVQDADLLIHVVDLNDPGFENHMAQVQKVLEQIEADHIKQIRVFNKIDALSEPDEKREYADRLFPKSVAVSAKTGHQVDRLIELIDDELNYSRFYTFLIPYSHQKLLNHLYNQGSIVSKNYLDEGVKIKAKMNKRDVKPVEEYRIA
ncbi:MAG: GTPase HflX [Proteobacteria bacterium]|nr:GTPase HflX [Pseudomonadota bacterium]